jgi:hypothetical protein
MRLNRKRKFIILFYLGALLYLLSSVPMIKSWPCGCTFRCETWIWEKTPLLFDSSGAHSDSEGVVSLNWSIDWWLIAVRFSMVTVPFLVVFAFLRDRRKAGTE